MTSAAPVVPDRPALYYPRIHFQDLEWLKATLLAFGRVYRIVPDQHPLDRDPPELVAISQAHGAKDPLVFEVSPEDAAIEEAQIRLNEQLNMVSVGELRSRFGSYATQVSEAAGGRYQIHVGKMNGGLLQMLVSHDLAWPTARSVGPGDWVRLHPELGDAIMAVTAIASAKTKGQDIVTDAEELHASVAALDDAAVMRRLTSQRKADTGTELAADHTAAELAHVIMTTRFDVSQLSFAEVGKMVRDGADLRAFRNQLVTFAQRLPPELDQKTREERLEEIAEDVMKEWQRLDKSLLKRLFAGAGEGAAKAGEDLAKEAVKWATTAGAGLMAAKVTAASTLAVVAPAAVPIAFTMLGAATLWRRTRNDGPLRYLTHLRKAGGIQMTIPCSYRRKSGNGAGSADGSGKK